MLFIPSLSYSWLRWIRYIDHCNNLLPYVYQFKLLYAFILNLWREQKSVWSYQKLFIYCRFMLFTWRGMDTGLQHILSWQNWNFESSLYLINLLYSPTASYENEWIYIYYTDGLHIWNQLFLGEKFVNID